MLLVEVYQGTGNHGCSQRLTMEFVEETAEIGIIVAACGCSSCWQVGHDYEDAKRYEQDYLGKRVALVGMTAAQFAEHIRELEVESDGKLAEDGAQCREHWFVID